MWTPFCLLLVLGCFLSFRLGPLLLIQENFNTTAYNNSLDKSVLPKLWQRFGELHFLFPHDNAPMHEAKSLKTFFFFQFVLWRHCCPKKNDSISHFSKCPKMTCLLLTKPSGCSYYDGRKFIDRWVLL